MKINEWMMVRDLRTLAEKLGILTQVEDAIGDNRADSFEVEIAIDFGKNVEGWMKGDAAKGGLFLIDKREHPIRSSTSRRARS